MINHYQLPRHLPAHHFKNSHVLIAVFKAYKLKFRDETL